MYVQLCKDETDYLLLTHLVVGGEDPLVGGGGAVVLVVVGRAVGVRVAGAGVAAAVAVVCPHQAHCNQAFHYQEHHLRQDF